MRAVLTISLIFCVLKPAVGQSPFNYGQNKNVYFISSKLRNTLDIKTIYTIDQRPEKDPGGMWENWDLTRITFDSNTTTDDWFPISMDSTFNYHFDSLLAHMQFLNGNRYHFTNGILMSYGGGGYGSFDWKEISRFSDTISIVATSCAGHCGEQAIQYSKNICNKKGQLNYTIRYPTPDENEDGIEGEMSLQVYEKLLRSKVSSENLPDTLYYYYDKNGLLLNTHKQSRMKSTDEIKELFTHVNDLAGSKFHQCYIGKVTMESYVLEKLGFAPDFILLELYRYGVFSFRMNPSDQKYYRTNDIILEQ